MPATSSIRSPKVPGSAVASAAVGCAPAPDLSKQSTGLRPHSLPNQPARARVGAPEGVRAPRDPGAAAPFARWASRSFPSGGLTFALLAPLRAVSLSEQEACRCALRAIFDVLPRHRPVPRLCRPKLQARSAVSGAVDEFFELDVLFSTNSRSLLVVWNLARGPAFRGVGSQSEACGRKPFDVRRRQLGGRRAAIFPSPARTPSAPLRLRRKTISKSPRRAAKPSPVIPPLPVNRDKNSLCLD
jgi:hypothetical protein